MTSYALMTYSFGMLGMSLVKVLAPGYFARQDTKTPVRMGMIALAVNIGINLVGRAARRPDGVPGTARACWRSRRRSRRR